MYLRHLFIASLLSAAPLASAATSSVSISAAVSAAGQCPAQRLDLAGEWAFLLHDAPDSVAASGTLHLPGTLDTNGVGIPVPPSEVTTQLSRRVTYTGKATYSRDIDIPESMSGKTVELTLERTRPTTVRVDGVDAGFRNSISAPQTYDLTTFLTPGRHTVEITVDNGGSIPLAVRNNSHACAESTQTNWNGIIGEIAITAYNPTRFADILVTPDIKTKSFRISGTLHNAGKTEGVTVTASSPSAKGSRHTVAGPSGRFDITLPLGSDAPLWSEWTPALHDIRIEVADTSGATLDERTLTAGLREFATSGTHFTINGDTTFLRGRHDACVWPLTAHVPMEIEPWRNYFKTIKSYGLNHVRFHSWCPPEACFAAADEAGVYLQPELTIWGEIDKDTKPLLDFLNEDMEAILKAYSHHPSFTMFAIGNELWGDTDIMREYIDKARESVPGLLATYGSNIYLGWNGHIPGEDFLVTCRVGAGEGYSTHARASFSFADADNGGIMNSSYPNTEANFSGAIAKSPVPVVGHETGQYQFYPDFSETDKYTGALRADNLATFRERAQQAGTLRKSRRFFQAAGEWATRLYKADMEMNLRTPGMGGFQLLDIQDYPGQGTALVGILDAFLDPKGFLTPEEWRQSCSDLTILAELPKRCFTSGETARIPLKLANYGPRGHGGSAVAWSFPFAQGTTTVAGDKGLLDAGTISFTAPEVKKPEKTTLTLTAADGLAVNSYDIWIFPKDSEAKKVKGVTVTDNLDEALRLLAKGKKVVLCPDTALTARATLGPLFQTDYWNYRMFRTICENLKREPSPGTLGLLIDDGHPIFSNYPTDFHTDWQWFPVASNSRPLIIDRLPATFDPIVEPIDNVERNYRLALIFECMVGKGKLTVIMADMKKAAEYPEGRWLLQTAKEYMASKLCKPRVSLTPAQLRDLLTRPSSARLIRELNNNSYQQ